MHPFVANDRIPTLYIFSGLPGTGKTSLAQHLAGRTRAAYLRIDTLEQALRDLCGVEVQGEGYQFSYRIAADNLRLGISVVADSCNPIESTRNEWELVALETKARYIHIEVICSDRLEHRRRVETRQSNISGLKLPTWKEVESRRYHQWTRDRIIILILCSRKSESECFEDLLSRLSSLHVRP